MLTNRTAASGACGTLGRRARAAAGYRRR